MSTETSNFLNFEDNTSEEKVKNLIDSAIREQAPVKKTQPLTKKKKIGRNQPCPCGSGKKYKKCCLITI